MKVETPQILWHNTLNGSQKENGKNSPILSCDLLDGGDAIDGAHVVVVGGSSANAATTSATTNDTAGGRNAILATAGGTEVNLWRVGFTSDAARTTTASGASKILVKPQMPGAAAAATTGPSSTHANGATTTTTTTSSEHTQISHILTLSKYTNERTINGVKFSPDGHHLCAVGDGGLVVVWSLPGTNCNNVATAAYRWCNTLTDEKDLQFKSIFNQSDDVMDISWCYSSKRFTVCSLDHMMVVYELVLPSSSSSSDGGGGVSSTAKQQQQWTCVHRSTKDHTHYIQGVAYDPKGVYLASQGSDRMVKVYSRKVVKEREVKEGLGRFVVKGCEEEVEEEERKDGGKETKVASAVVVVIEGENVSVEKMGGGEETVTEGNGVADKTEGATPATEEEVQTDATAISNEHKHLIIQSKVLPDILTNSKFELQNKTKTLKFLNGPSSGKSEGAATTTTTTNGTTAGGSNNDGDTNEEITDGDAKGKEGPNNNAKRHHMFADELTVGSFFRRLAFTPDGAFLVAPAALWHGSEAHSNGSSEDTGNEKAQGDDAESVMRSPTSVAKIGGDERIAEASFATYLFARHHFDQPYKVLTGLEKVS